MTVSALCRWTVCIAKHRQSAQNSLGSNNIWPRAKFDNVLIFDAIENKNLAPELPMSNPAYSYVVNRNGNVVIGGKMADFCDLRSYAQTPVAVAARNAQTKVVEYGVNAMHIWDNKRKVWINAYAMDNTVMFRFGQQVSSFWGWNVYKESYWMQPGDDHAYRGTWADYRLDKFNNEQMWRVTERLSDGTFVLVGVRIPDYGGYHMPVREHATVFAADMGIANKGSILIEYAY